MSTTTISPWRICEWTDDNGRVVKELAFHDDETAKVLNLPFPPGAVAREPIMELTQFSRAKPYLWFRRRLQLLRVGDIFTENINQGDRWCTVLAVDPDTGAVLYDYEMPRGKIFMRIDGKPVNEKKLNAKWRRLLNGE